MTAHLNELLRQQPILLFDGECGFCNRTVLFLLKRERQPKLRFAALQSETGRQLCNYFQLPEQLESVVLIKNHGAYIKSCAALRLTRYMKGLWPLLMVFVLIPPFVRNRVYDYIAARRMKWFGRVSNCALLPADTRVRFIDGGF